MNPQSIVLSPKHYGKYDVVVCGGGTAAALLRGTGLAARDIDINLLRTTLKQNNVKC